jgi:hypothetical protein
MELRAEVQKEHRDTHGMEQVREAAEGARLPHTNASSPTASTSAEASRFPTRHTWRSPGCSRWTA